MRHFFLIFTLVWASLAGAQERSSLNFGPPMRVPLLVTAGYGEIRPDHFHSGIDFSTYGKRQDVIAIEKGYVSRIRASAYGYGNAIYINHPNGFTSVYAHLSEFHPKLTEHLRRVQENNREFETDVFLDSLQFQVEKGQKIGYSGNSGSSTAPHLHFEIRDQFFQNTLNPLLFGYAETDQTPPAVNQLFVLPKRGMGRANGKENILALPLVYNKKKKKKTVSPKVPVPVISGWAGIGFSGGDVIGKARNQTGIYQIRLLVDSTEIFLSRLDAFSFNETRCVNAFMNYRERLLSRRKIIQCLVPENNMIGIYKAHQNLGYYYFGEDRKYQIRLELTDLAGNRTVQEFQVKGKMPEFELNDSLQARPGYRIVEAGIDQQLSLDNELEVFFEPECLFETQDIKFRKSQQKGPGNTYEIGSIYIPMNQKMKVRIRPDGIPDSLFPRLVMVRQRGAEKEALEAVMSDGWIEALSNEFGDFSLAIDSVAPKILHNKSTKYKTVKKGRRRVKVPINEPGPVQARGTIRFTISDRLSGVGSIQTFLDQQWILLEPGEAAGQWEYRFPETLDFGCHVLVITAIDKVGNKSTFELELDKWPPQPAPTQN